MYIHIVLLQILTLGIATSDIHYVRTTDSPPSSCPGQPCLTLHQYAQENNFTTGTTLLFLPGNHSLQQSVLNLTSVSNITLRGEESVNIICTNVVTIRCESVTGFNIEGLTFLFSFTGKGYQASALQLIKCSGVLISNTLFQGAEDATGRAIYVQLSEVTVMRCVFEGNSAEEGGAILADSNTNLTVSGCSFTGNEATRLGGGAIYVATSILLLDGSIPNYFTSNIASSQGGAINCHQCTLEMRGDNLFQNNLLQNNLQPGHCQEELCGHGGGALALFNEVILTISGRVHFSYNTASAGGAIYMVLATTLLNGNITLFKNSANQGGGIYIGWRSAITNTKYLSFIGNTAQSKGGALYAKDSNVTFSGSIRIVNNTGELGGGICVQDTLIEFRGNTLFTSNSASDGGAIYSLQGTVSFHGLTLFTHNMANESGGALYAAGTVMHIQDKVNFTFNTACNGGAMYLAAGASLTLQTDKCNTLLSTAFNSAHQYGGGMYYEDSPTISQCCYRDSDRLSLDTSKFKTLPYCFFKTQLIHIFSENCSLFTSTNDSASEDGSFLYGGLLDRCRISTLQITGTILVRTGIMDFSHQANGKELASKPYTLCICNKDQSNISDCTKTRILIHVYRGQKFTVPLLATAQVGTTSTTVTAITSARAKLEIYQTSQPLPDYCHPLPYTLYCNDSHEQVVLYPDGPCRDTGSARVVIDVTLLPCPDGFTQSGELCTCEDRLHHYHVNCTIDDIPYLTKAADSKFWMGVLYTNTTYEGLVLGKSCPVEYCKTGTVRITLDNPDIQCDLNRSGLLCGACASNHSLMLGSSQCQVCPNTYLALLVPFAAAGIALVVFLTFLRLTVASGTLNSVILYANIVQVNRKLFFPANTRNVLTVFLAWMNLDLGFQTCFYDGLDAYIQTWLQFAFPLYVWLLIGLMIFISRYSITVSKLIGSNPIAVLATLLFMSYTKILKIIIEVYSSVDLDYPDKTVTVWLKDANVPYLQSQHLLLTVVTSLFLVFLFLPYTLLLLLGHKLYRFTGRKHWHWLNRLKPLLDSYYAPYKIHTRYWTGFLLLIRCALYVLLLLNSFSTSENLLIILLTFTAIGFFAGFVYSGRIYKKLHVNIIEACIYLNLIVLSAITQTGLTIAALVYSLVGLVFTTMIVLSAHQFYLLYIAKTTLCLRLKNKWPHFRKNFKTAGDTPHMHGSKTSHDPHEIVTETVIDLREPLLDL